MNFNSISLNKCVGKYVMNLTTKIDDKLLLIEQWNSGIEDKKHYIS